MTPVITPAQPVAKIEILLLSDGRIVCNFGAAGNVNAGRDTFNMMVARASQDVVAQMVAQEARARDGVEVAPPDFDPGKN